MNTHPDPPTTASMTEAESLKAILSSIFRRRGEETEKTKLFDNLPQQVQEGLCAAVSVLPDEMMVLASVLSGNHWVLISTRRVLFNRMGKIISVDHLNLKDVTVALAVDASKGISRKSDLTSLKLTVQSGEEEVIEVEPGLPHSGIWNMLKHMSMRGSSNSISV